MNNMSKSPVSPSAVNGQKSLILSSQHQTNPQTERQRIRDRWTHFVQNYVSAFGMPTLVQSLGPGRTVSFQTLEEIKADSPLSLLTHDRTMCELEREWAAQLQIPKTPRALIAELQLAEGFSRPLLVFLYPEASELRPSFIAWAQNRASTDAIRDQANEDAPAQGAVVYAKLTELNGDEPDAWVNEKARQYTPGQRPKSLSQNPTQYGLVPIRSGAPVVDSGARSSTDGRPLRPSSRAR